MEYLIRGMVNGDAEEVLRIYQAGLDGGEASFETTAPTWEAFDSGRLAPHRYVAVATADGVGPRGPADGVGPRGPADGARERVVGWVAVSPVSSRPVYAGVVEHSVYVAAAAQGHGIGGALLDTLISSTEAAGIWTIQSSVFPENGASLALHRRAGFRVVGTRERIARHHGRWRDTVFLERRSAVVA
jgi:phosphinothricin acetyltransferase